jgi:putative Holliday junction resolvase
MMKSNGRERCKMKIMAVDYGDARTGLAACDPMETLAYPIGVIHEKNRMRLLEKVALAAREQNAGLVIIGYPKNRNNTLGERARLTEDFTRQLEKLLDVPAELWDERGTTLAAHAALNMGTTTGKKKRQVVDAVAATILLESYLAYRRSKGVCT